MNSALPTSAQAPSSNDAAVATLAAPASTGSRWRVNSVNWSYSGTPTGGSLVIAWADGGTNYTETYYISAGGPGSLRWQGRAFPPEAQVTFTLAAGGSGISGTVYVDGYVSK